MSIEDVKADVKTIGTKLDDFHVRIANIEALLEVYNSLLEVHIEGVKENKRRNDLLEQKHNMEVLKFEKTMAPIESHVKIVNFTFRYMFLPITIAVAIFWIKTNF